MTLNMNLFTKDEEKKILFATREVGILLEGLGLSTVQVASVLGSLMFKLCMKYTSREGSMELMDELKEQLIELWDQHE